MPTGCFDASCCFDGLWSRRSRMSIDLQEKLDAMWERMKHSGDTVTLAEAGDFFGKKFGRLSAEAMLSEVDTNHDGQMSKDEWHAFWQKVLVSGYSEEDVTIEVDAMMSGGAWVDWKDGVKPAFARRSIQRIGHRA
mmetsp:Transcript_17406/g.47519  ORF Transcript_17406/g.47519 Transcript_17406/m.47519 type:complete len:136 (-) Transcript_17406:168-575(-)